MAEGIIFRLKCRLDDDGIPFDKPDDVSSDELAHAAASTLIRALLAYEKQHYPDSGSAVGVVSGGSDPAEITVIMRVMPDEIERTRELLQRAREE